MKTLLSKISGIKLNIDDKFKGYAWVLLAILAVSNVYIFSKVALNLIEVLQFGVYWFGFGILWVVIFTNKAEGIYKIKNIPPKATKVYVIVGILEIISTGAFFYAMKQIENPSITAFLTNLSPVFVTLLGVTILRDRFRFIELVGAIFAISGAFIISYRHGAHFSSYFSDGTVFVYLSSICGAISIISIKKNIKLLSPQLLTLNRLIFIWVFALIVFFFSPYSITIPAKAILAIMAGSFFGPFLSIISTYNALRYLDASKQSILTSTKSLFVLFGAYLYFGNFPANFQIFGGLLTVLGAFLVSFGKFIGKKQHKA